MYFAISLKEHESIINYLRKFDGRVLYPTAKAVVFTTLIIICDIKNYTTTNFSLFFKFSSKSKCGNAKQFLKTTLHSHIYAQLRQRMMNSLLPHYSNLVISDLL